MKGLHLIGDLHGCRCEPGLLRDAEQFRNACSGLVRDAGLTAIGDKFHVLDGSGFTCTILLAESHLSVHSWPNEGGLSMDLFTSDDAPESRARAQQLFDAIAAYFMPSETSTVSLERGHPLLLAPLNDTVGSYVRAERRLGAWQSSRQRMALYQTAHFGKVLRLDGSNTLSEREEFIYHENLIHPAMTAHAGPKTILIIGGADGGAAEEVLKHPMVERVTLVEPDAELIDLAKTHLAEVHRGAFDNPKLRVVQRDGVHFVRDTADKFDLIVLDPKGTRDESLYSPDVLQRLRAVLAPGGALVVNMGAPATQPQHVGELAQQLTGIFRIVRAYTVYLPLLGTQWAMAVCSDKLDAKAYTADEIDRRIEQRKLSDLGYYNGETHEAVFALPNFIRDLAAPPRVKTPRNRRLSVVRTAAR